MYSKSFENLTTAVDILIICGPPLGRFFGYFARIMSAPRTCKPDTMPALARTLLAKPRLDLKRLLSMMGCTIPPTEEPDATMHIVRDRMCGEGKCCATTATAGMYVRPAPSPIATPCERKIYNAPMSELAEGEIDGQT